MALKTSRFSKPQLLTFAIVFAAIGGIVIYKSLAATSNKSSCTTTVSSIAAANSALASAASGDVVCLSAGTYGAITISANKVADVTLQSAGGASVTLGGVEFAGTSKHIILSDFTITGGVNVGGGADFVTITHNDITGSGNAINYNTCASITHSPGGCGPIPQITNSTISYNKIHGCGPSSTTGSRCNEDGLRVNNFNNLNIHHNEIYDVIEDPSFAQHNDGLQTVFGGSNITFDHNYLHDNCAQNLFFKDGDITGATITNNLFVRNNNIPAGGCGSGAWSIQLFDTKSLVLRNNTEQASGSILRCDASGFGYNATVDHNIFTQFHNSSGDPCSFALTESYNIFGLDSWTFTKSTTDTLNANPAFVNTAVDDYRLASNPNGIGVDWKPSDFTYGPRDAVGPPPPPAPSVSLSASPATISVGQNSTLSWSSTNATSCTATGAWSGTKATSGNLAVSPASTSTYSITCSGTGGSASDSATITVSLQPGCTMSSTAWQNSAFAVQTGSFTANYSTIPSATGVDGVTGFSNGQASDYTNLAAIVRFNTGGTIDARNGTDYGADTVLSYNAGQTYNVRMIINVTNHTYSVYVTPPGGNEVALASNYAFRSEQASVSQLSNWALISIGASSHQVCGMQITTSSTPPPTPGDLNNDSHVTITDLSILLSNYGSTNTSADVNKDGTVNITDLSILLSHYGT